MEFFILISFFIVAISFLLLFYYLLPKRDSLDTTHIPDSYFISNQNRIDLQKKYECAALSCAYLLRHIGVEADGNKLYEHFPRKLITGVVAPKGIILFFKRRGYKLSFVRGDINTLKKRISNGLPVIAFVKVFPNKNYLHYVPVIGYDKDQFYFTDSLKYTINCHENNYNRITPVNEFEKVWKTQIPFYTNTYFVLNDIF